MEDKLEVGENLSPSILNSKLGKGDEKSIWMPDIDFKNDLGPLSRKMIGYWGFEQNITQLLGKDALDYMNFSY